MSSCISKLREKHTTAVGGLTVNLGSTLALTPATTLAVDSLDYADNLRIRNQQFSQVGIRPKVDYYYAGGFISLTPSAVGYPITVIYDLSFHSFLRELVTVTPTINPDHSNGEPLRSPILVPVLYKEC